MTLADQVAHVRWILCPYPFFSPLSVRLHRLFRTQSIQATRATTERATGPGPNVAERGIAPPSERHHYVAEDGTQIEYREPSFLTHNDRAPVLSAPGSVRPYMHSGTSSHASMSMASSGAMTPLDPSEGLRLCHLVKWPNVDGYGFAVTPDRRRQGHFIAHVDIGSPAHLGGLRRKDRIVEVNGYDVEGQSYRDVINRIKNDPTKVDLLVIDRETDNDFARRKRTPSSLVDTVVQRWTPAVRPRSPPGVAANLQDKPKSPATSRPPSVTVPWSASSGSSKAPNSQQAMLTATAKPAACSYNTDRQGQRVEPQCAQSKTVPSEVGPTKQGPASFQHVLKDHGPSTNHFETLPTRKSQPIDTAKQPPKPRTTASSEQSPFAPESGFRTASSVVPPELNEDGCFPDKQTKNAADYFPYADENSGHPSAPFTPTHSGSPSPFGTYGRTPPGTSPPTAHSPRHGRRHSSPWCPATRVFSQGAYFALPQVSPQDEPTTYAPGYSDFFTMYSGYASGAPLSSATEARSSRRQVEQQGGTDTSQPASSETTDAQ